MPIDPQIFRDLDAQAVREDPLPHILIRLGLMGILPVWTADGRYYDTQPEMEQRYRFESRFAQQINYRPWNAHLIRKEQARQDRLRWLYFEVETIGYLGSPTPAALLRNLQRLEDIGQERLVLLGWDGPLPAPRRPGRRRPT